jgi:hypothetical protein
MTTAAALTLILSLRERNGFTLKGAFQMEPFKAVNAQG